MADNNFKSGYSDVGGLNMYYEIYGQGKPLVLIHGGGSTIETTFGRIIPLLSRHRQIIGVELQAHGHTGDRDIDLSFEQDADDVANLLKQLNIFPGRLFRIQQRRADTHRSSASSSAINQQNDSGFCLL